METGMGKREGWKVSETRWCWRQKKTVISC